MTDWKFIFEKHILRQHRPPYEKAVKKKLQEFHGKLFIDVGANRGLYSRMLSKNFERVYAFEPNPKILPLLKKGLPSNVSVFEVALSENNGITTLFFGPDSLSGSADTILPVFQYKPSPPREDWKPYVHQTFIGKEGVSVRKRSFDSYELFPELVKIDVEGAEFLVLEGMKYSLADKRVLNILVELHNLERREELQRLFDRVGYASQWIDPDHLLASGKEE